MFLKKKTAASTRIAKPEMNLKKKSVKRPVKEGKQFLAYSPEFKQFVKENKGVLSDVYKLLSKEQNFEALGKGEKFRGKGFVVQKAATGGYKGCLNIVTAKVETGGKEFFVKVCIMPQAKKVLEAFEIVDEYLKSKGNKLGKFNAKVLKPHLLYQNAKYIFLVTDFYKSNEVKQVLGMNGRKGIKIEVELSKLQKILGKWVGDISQYNTFYEPKTNTIWFFDLLKRA